MAEIGAGLLVLVGVARGDDEEAARRLAAKTARLRVFDDLEGRLSLNVLEAAGAVLAVSQFTLIADTAKGNRPSFSDAAPAGEAEPLFGRYCAELEALGARVERGAFGEHMLVDLVNDGPVTIVLE